MMTIVPQPMFIPPPNGPNRPGDLCALLFAIWFIVPIAFGALEGALNERLNINVGMIVFPTYWIGYGFARICMMRIS